MSRRSEIQRRHREATIAMDAARRLAAYLAGGGLPEAQDCWVRLQAGEACYGEGEAELSQYFARDLQVVASDWWVRSEAARQAAAQWREFGVVNVVVTSARLLVCHHGRWSSWWYSHVRHLQPNLDGLALTLYFEGQAPSHLEGPFVPWLSVLLVHLLYARVLELPDDLPA